MGLHIHIDTSDDWPVHVKTSWSAGAQPWSFGCDEGGSMTQQSMQTDAAPNVVIKTGADATVAATLPSHETAVSCRHVHRRLDANLPASNI